MAAIVLNMPGWSSYEAKFGPAYLREEVCSKRLNFVDIVVLVGAVPQRVLEGGAQRGGTRDLIWGSAGRELQYLVLEKLLRHGDPLAAANAWRVPASMQDHVPSGLCPQSDHAGSPCHFPCEGRSTRQIGLS